MKRVIINKIFSVITLALILFASFSLAIISYQVFSYYEKNLTSIANDYKQEITLALEENPNADINALIKKYNTSVIHFNIISNDGEVFGESGIKYFANTSNKEVLETRKHAFIVGDGVRNMSKEKIFKDAINSDKAESKIYKVMNYTDDSMRQMAFAMKVDVRFLSPNAKVIESSIFYTSINFNTYDMGYYWIIPIIIGIMAIIMVGSYYFVRNIASDISDPLLGIKKMLYDINSGDYERVSVHSKYRDVQQIFDELLSANAKLASSLKYLNFEQNKMNFLLENMVQGIIALSSDNNVLIANKTALNFFGCTKNLLGGKIDTLITDQALLSKIDQYNDSGAKTVQFECEMKNRYFRIFINVLSEEWYSENNLYIKVITFNDVTEEYESSKMRSEFFANASHELKTPLTAITGFSELLTFTKEESSITKCANEINKNAKKMQLLISDMLKLSKMEANISEDDFEVINLRKIADEVVAKILPITRKKDITVSVSGKAEIFGNDNKIEEVFTNLIDNAIKYNNHGGYVYVAIAEMSDKIMVTIKDNGIGIASENLSRLFERFYVVDKSRDKKIDSTGLGLSIVKHIISNHHGNIAVESQLKVGTKFTITFPKIDINARNGKAMYD